jgi:hypothetical protein
MILVHNRKVSEPFSNHKVQGIGGTCIRFRAKGIFSHNLCDRDISGLNSGSDDSKGKIFRSEDTGNAVIVIRDQNTVLALCGHQLSGFGHGSIGFDLKGRTRPESKNSAWRGFSHRSNAASLVLLLAEIRLDLTTDGLERISL